MGDQFDFANGMNDIGCGIGLKQMSSVTGTVLGDAIILDASKKMV
jgi:hypothetical protein